MAKGLKISEDLLGAHCSQVLLFGVRGTYSQEFAHRLELDGPALPERVRAALKMITARKRGPTKKAVQSVRPDAAAAKRA